MLNKSLLLAIIIIFYSGITYSRDHYEINIDTRKLYDGKLKVELLLPDIKENKATWVIPQIIPGTYMRVNYSRFYSNIKAYSKDGKQLSLARKEKNVFRIKNAAQADRLVYYIKPSDADRKIWDNILVCAGTVFAEDKFFLMNFQLIAGYLEGYQHLPFIVNIQKTDALYIATGLAPVKDQQSYRAEDYATLIDNPVMISVPDTASFRTGNATFKIAVFAEKGVVHATDYIKYFEPIARSMNGFFRGQLPSPEYHFLIYMRDVSKTKGMFKFFGVGSALEHKRSSVYYLNDNYRDTASVKKYLGYQTDIALHEYLHQLTPLSMHSGEIEHFNFREPVMSQQLWMYEGMTEYFGDLCGARDSLTGRENFITNFSYAAEATLKQRKRSLTETSRHCVKYNMLDFPGRIIQLGRQYEAGRFAALIIDMMLDSLSHGTRRLEDVMHDLNQVYRQGHPFDDDTFLQELSQKTYPEIGVFIKKHISGTEPMPVREYISKLGWEYIAKGQAYETYGDTDFRYDRKQKRLYVKKAGNNALGLHNGDSILTEDASGHFSDSLYAQFFKHFNTPAGEPIVVTIIREGKRMELRSATPVMARARYGQVRLKKQAARQEEDYRNAFIHKTTRTFYRP